MNTTPDENPNWKGNYGMTTSPKPKTDKTTAVKLTGPLGESAEVYPRHSLDDHPVALTLTDSSGRYVSLSFTQEEVAQIARHLKGITKAAVKKQREAEDTAARAAADLAVNRDRVAAAHCDGARYLQLSEYSRALIDHILELEAAK